MNDFFQKRLAALVDTSTMPQRYKPVAKQNGLTTQMRAQVERAACIQNIFFRADGHTPAKRMDFKLVETDATITQFILGKLPSTGDFATSVHVVRRYFPLIVAALCDLGEEPLSTPWFTRVSTAALEDLEQDFVAARFDTALLWFLDGAWVDHLRAT